MHSRQPAAKRWLEWTSIGAALAKATIRLRDIAEKTGFSTNTVSLALRDSSRIPEETRAKIRAAALELGEVLKRLQEHVLRDVFGEVAMPTHDVGEPKGRHPAVGVEPVEGRGRRLVGRGDADHIHSDTTALRSVPAPT